MADAIDKKADILPESHAGTDPDTPPERRDDDARSDIEQAVQSQVDAAERGDGGTEPETFTDTAGTTAMRVPAAR